MNKKVYAVPDLKVRYFFESDVMFTSGGFDTLIEDDNIFDIGGLE